MKDRVTLERKHFLSAQPKQKYSWYLTHPSFVQVYLFSVLSCVGSIIWDSEKTNNFMLKQIYQKTPDNLEN